MREGRGGNRLEGRGGLEPREQKKEREKLEEMGVRDGIGAEKVDGRRREVGEQNGSEGDRRGGDKKEGCGPEWRGDDGGQNGNRKRGRSGRLGEWRGVRRWKGR